MPVSSVPQPIFGPLGFVAPSQADILAGVLTDMNAAFGGNMNPALETPQGQLASSTAAVIGDKDDQFVALSNQFDPAYATGRFQDALARIYFLERNPAEPTTVTATCTGLAQTPIPAGSLAQSTDGSLYICTDGGVIGAGGSVDLAFQCAITGPVPCPADTLTGIYRAIPGWDAINNAADGIVGNAVESRADFEFRREQSVAINARGILNAILGAVLAVPNVLDAYATENPTAAPVTIRGVSVAAHALYVAVAGGDAQAVARAIWTKKAPGCAYVGNTTETVEDNNSGYSMPYPSYEVTFETPAALAFVFLVKISTNSGIPDNADVQIQAAILAAFVGADGGTRARIGSDVFASRFYTPVALLGSWAEIISITIGTRAATAAAFTASISGTVMTVTAVGSGTLAVGQVLAATGLLAGTVITALGSGSGGTGTYSVNNSQTFASAAVNAYAAASTLVSVNMDKAPTITAADIGVIIV